MNIHEFQAKQILEKKGIHIPPYFVISSLEEAEALLRNEQWQSAVVKIQVHAGGRGKAGGVKIGRSTEEVLSYVKDLLGMKIINQQTGPQGMIAHQLIISPVIPINHEYYLGITISREHGEIILIASSVGGVEIEQVAEDYPDKICLLRLPFDGHLRPYHYTRLAQVMNWQGSLLDQGKQLVESLIESFIEYDATLIEINPLVKTEKDQLVALDAKVVIDENALYRQPIIKNFFDPKQVPENEARAQQSDLSYISLEGEIGCMVNGAGLAMATMDIIHHYGGRPANFLDVGGSATKEKVTEGFKIILSDPNVKGILVNIFGGIMNCETLANGIIEAAKEINIHVPLVVRMEGTSVEKGIEQLSNSDLDIVIASSLAEAAKQIVKLSYQEGV